MFPRRPSRKGWPASSGPGACSASGRQALHFCPPGAEIWIDGGHNPGARPRHCEAMATFEERDPRPLFLIIGMINTKEPIGYSRLSLDLTEQVFTVPVHGSDAGLDPLALAADAAAAGSRPMQPPRSPKRSGRSPNSPTRTPCPPRVLIGGSLYLVGDVLAENGTPPR